MATLSTQGLSKSYGRTRGIEDISLEIGDGEFFVILGPSGAGKTTTLKSVAGLVDVDAGEVHIGGVSMQGVEPYHRNVAMAFESYALYPQKTVSQNLASPLRSGRTGRYSEDDQKQRIDLVTTTLGINHLLARFPRELSNGQRQRVALGRVLVRPADVYLLDEPLSHLDAKLRAAMRAELKQLGEMSSTTSLYVTHDYQEALALGDRVAVLRKGRLVQVGTPSEVWNHPVDTFVAKALGQPEINLIDAVVEQGVLRTSGQAFQVPLRGDLELASGDRARVGIRPRDIELSHGEPREGHLRVRGRVRLSERLGREIELTVDADGVELVAVVPGAERIEEGDGVELDVPIGKVHVFAAPDGDDPSADSLRLGAATAESSGRAEVTGSTAGGQK
jgi:multiple sugar transport system ATP-binding protein